MHYDKINDQFKQEFFKLTDAAEKIVITSHISPDDDSIASVLAMYRLLSDRYLDKSVRMIYTGESVKRYGYFQSFDRIEFVDDVADHFKDVDLLIGLDGSQYSRFTENSTRLEKSTDRTICIDHHSSPIDEFDLSLVDAQAPATAFIIYQLFYKDSNVDKSLAETLLLGILGDTGNFAYLKPHQIETLLTAKRLIEAGQVEIQEFQSKYRTISRRVFDLIREFIKNTKYYQVEGWPDFQASQVTRDVIQPEEYSDNEISEANHIYMAHYLRVIEGCRWGFVITPKSDGTCGISLRSLPGSVNVRGLVERMGIGGGHDRAAGGTFEVKEDDKPREVKECLEEVLSWMKKNEPVFS